MTKRISYVVDATTTTKIAPMKTGKIHDPLLLRRIATTTRGGGGGWFGQNSIAEPPMKTSSSKRSLDPKQSKKKSSIFPTPALGNNKKKKIGLIATFSDFVSTVSSVGSNIVVDRIYHGWWFGQVPEIFRFCFTGSLANVFFLWLEHLLFVVATESPTATIVLTSVFDVEEDHAATISYTIAYLLQIVTTHMLNALLVYGLSTVDTFSKYVTTLRRQFYAYSTGMVLSVMLFGYLTSTSRPQWLQWMDRRTALWTTTFIIAGVNYVVIGKIMKDPSTSSSSARNK